MTTASTGYSNPSLASAATPAAPSPDARRRPCGRRSPSAEARHPPIPGSLQISRRPADHSISYNDPRADLEAVVDGDGSTRFGAVSTGACHFRTILTDFGLRTGQPAPCKTLKSRMAVIGWVSLSDDRSGQYDKPHRGAFNQSVRSPAFGSPAPVVTRHSAGTCDEAACGSGCDRRPDTTRPSAARPSRA